MNPYSLRYTTDSKSGVLPQYPAAARGALGGGVLGGRGALALHRQGP